MLNKVLLNYFIDFELGISPPSLAQAWFSLSRPEIGLQF